MRAPSKERSQLTTDVHRRRQEPDTPTHAKCETHERRNASSSQKACPETGNHALNQAQPRSKVVRSAPTCYLLAPPKPKK
eukprot:scaffold51852_cov27-Tisochrysis_lutea.AAC.2